MYMNLFSEISIGSQVMKNRIMMSQSVTGLAESNRITEQLIAYYAERVIGGAGLIEMEPALIGVPGIGKAVNMLSLFAKDNSHKWHELSELFHTYGAKLIGKIKYRYMVPVSKVNIVLQKIVNTAQQMREAGIDGISLVQSDESRECRNNVCMDYETFDCGGLEALDEVKDKEAVQLGKLVQDISKACGKDFLVGAHMNLQQSHDITPDIGECIKSAKALERAGISYLVVPGENTKLVKAINENVEIPVAARVKYRSPDECSRLISDGTADIVVLDRQLICDPCWPEKAETGRKGEIRNCIQSCREACSKPGAGGRISCELNPYVGNESKYTEHNPGVAAKPKNIIVIGGGPAGMQAAITASKRGHSVSVFEKKEELGGMLLNRDNETAQWFIGEMKRNHVDARLGIPDNEEYIEAFKPEAVIIATGKKSRKEALISALRRKGINVIIIHSDPADGTVGSAIRSGFCVANRI